MQRKGTLYLPFIALLVVGLAAPASAAAKKPRGATIDVPMPTQGNATLARVELTVKAKGGAKIPKGFRIVSGIANEVAIPASVNVFTAVTGIERAKNGAKGTMTALVAVTRAVILPAPGGPQPASVVETTFRPAKGKGLSVSARHTIESDAFPKSPFGDGPLNDICEGAGNGAPISQVLDAIGGEEEIFGSSPAFPADDDLRHAFGWACQLPDVPVREDWFGSLGLHEPSTYRNCNAVEAMNGDAFNWHWEGTCDFQVAWLQVTGRPGSSITSAGGEGCAIMKRPAANQWTFTCERTANVSYDFVAGFDQAQTAADLCVRVSADWYGVNQIDFPACP